MRYYYLITLLIIGQNCTGQNNRIDSLFKEFKNDIEFEQKENFGVVVWDNETRESFYSLMNICSNESLINFSNDSNAAIRAYMFWGLVSNGCNKKVLQEVLRNHDNDTIEIREKNACITSTWKVIEYMHMTFNAEHQNKLKKINYKEEIEKIRYMPYVRINGVRHGFIEKEKLKELDSLSFSINGYQVTSFNLSIGNNTMYSRSNRITGVMKNKIQNLKPNDKIYFEDIKVRSADNMLRNVGSLTLKVR